MIEQHPLAGRIPPAGQQDLERIVSIDTQPDPPRLRITFMGDVLKTPGLKAITQLTLAVMETLDLDCAVLLSEGFEEQETERQILSGKSLLSIVLERLESPGNMEFPKLALVRKSLAPMSVQDQARNFGLRVGLVLDGYILISSVHDQIQ